MKLPSDLKILSEIYERYYEEFKNFSKDNKTRECKVYVPIDIRAVAADLETDEYLLFGRLYNYMNKKYEGNEESPLFILKDHSVHFPLLASILASLQEESKKQGLQELEHSNDKPKVTSSNVITATNSTVILGDSNVVTSETGEINIPKKAWHEKAAFKIIIPFVSALLVAYLVYYFGWK